MTVLYVYIIFISLVLILGIVAVYFFNSLAHRKISRKKIIKIQENVREIFNKHINQNINNISINELQKIKKLIGTRYGMNTLLEVVQEYVSQNGYDNKIKKYLNWIIDYKELLHNHIVRNKYRESYILYLLNQFYITGPEVNEYTFKSLQNNSIYARNNALRIASNSGDVCILVDALKRIDKGNKYFNDKVIIDNIDSFRGDIELLNSELLCQINNFSIHMRCLLIEHFRNNNCDDEKYKEGLEPFLNFCDNLIQTEEIQEYRELVMSATKYFGKVIYDVACKKILNNLSSPDWEIRAVSARVLNNYENDLVIEALEKTVLDSNWYVRFNSAFSLLSFKNQKDSIDKIINGKDKYGKEILLYAMRTMTSNTI